MRDALLLLPTLSLTIGLVLASGCESDSEAPSPDASATRTFDAGPLPDSAGPIDAATSNPDLGEGEDAGNDAALTTNGSTWSPATGLPETACTPWTLTNTANPKVPEIANGKLTISTTAGENIFYRQTDVITPAELVIEVRVRLISGTASVDSRGPVFVGFHYGTEKRKNALSLTSTEAFLLAGENTKGASAAVATTDAAHTYKIVTNTTTHAIQVFRDDVSILTGTAFPEAQDPTTAVPDIYWGEVSNFANGVSEWELVKHNAHSPTTCP